MHSMLFVIAYIFAFVWWLLVGTIFLSEWRPRTKVRSFACRTLQWVFLAIGIPFLPIALPLWLYSHLRGKKSNATA